MSSGLLSYDWRSTFPNQPVATFSHVFGDYTKERTLFDAAVEEKYNQNAQSVNNEYAQRISFIVSSLSEDELSDFTHKLNIWNSKKTRILSGERQVSLSDKDFTSEDAELVRALVNLFSLSEIENSEIIRCNEKFFMFSKEDAKKLTERHFDELYKVSRDQTLLNPVQTEVNDEGVLVFVD